MSGWLISYILFSYLSIYLFILYNRVNIGNSVHLALKILGMKFGILLDPIYRKSF